jgi:hypothetical protein
MAVILPSAASAAPRPTFPEEAHLPIRNQSDIDAIEAIPLSERALPESSYAALVDAAKRRSEVQALSFFLSADRLDAAHVWTYAEFVADVTRAGLCCTELTERAVVPVRIYSGNADASGLSKSAHAIERFNRDRNFGRTPGVAA